MNTASDLMHLSLRLGACYGRGMPFFLPIILFSECPGSLTQNRRKIRPIYFDMVVVLLSAIKQVFVFPQISVWVKTDKSEPNLE